MRGDSRRDESVGQYAELPVTYQYNALQRLANASSNQSWTEAYTYDGFGNLTQKTPTGNAPSLSVLVDPATNRVQGTGISYDANGNLTSTATFNLTYDVANRMTSENGDLYAYASDNHRIYHRTTAGADEVYVYGVMGSGWASIRLVAPGA